jgi:hypothetical protein
MTREEADQLLEQLNEEHPDRFTHRWLVREHAGEYSVVKVALPEGLRRDPLKATVEAGPSPRDADDPRTSLFRNIPPYGAA